MFRAKWRLLMGLALLSLSSEAAAQDAQQTTHKWDECEKPLQSDEGPKTLAVVRAARCLMDLGMYTRAAQTLTKHIDEMDESGAQGGRAVVEGLLQTALSQVAVIDVKTEQDAQLHVDGSAVGSFPASNPIFLEAGAHSIEAHIDDRKVQKRIEVVAGYMGTLDLAFAPQKTMAAKDKPHVLPIIPRKQPTRSHGSTWRIATMVASGIIALGGVGIGAGYVASGRTIEDVRSTAVAGFPLRTSQCTLNTHSDPCSRIAKWVDERDQAYRTAQGGFVAAGIGLAALTTAAAIRTTRIEPTKTTSTVATTIAPVDGGATVWLSGTF